jgi:hypothetical protein
MNRLVLVGAVAFVAGTAGGTWMSPARTATHGEAGDSTAVALSADSAAASHDGAPGDAVPAPPPAPEPEVPTALADSGAAMARAIDSLPVATAVAMLDRLAEEEVLAVLRRMELSRAVALIEKMPTDRGARLTRQLLLGGR